MRGARKHERWGLLLVNGLLGIVIGVIAAVWPGITVLAFVFMVGAWALLSGGLMFGAALGMKISHGRWWLVFGAIISMIYGLLLFASSADRSPGAHLVGGRPCTGLRRHPDRPGLQAPQASRGANSRRRGGSHLNPSRRSSWPTSSPKARRRPDFTLHVTPDQTLSLHEFAGRRVILAFYPADWSPVCGDQMSLYNHILPEFRRNGAELLGISVDGAWCHRRSHTTASCISRCSRTSNPKAPWPGRMVPTGTRTGSPSARCS